MLTSASGTVHTPRGNLNVSWKKSESGIDLQISGDTDAVRRIITNKKQKQQNNDSKLTFFPLQ